MLREQLLVRGDDVAARFQCARDVVERRIRAADQLDHELAAREDPIEVAALAAEDAAHSRPSPGDLLHHLRALVEQPAERTAHRPLAEDADVDDVAHWSRARRSSHVSRRTTTRASPSRQKITGGRGTPL